MASSSLTVRAALLPLVLFLAALTCSFSLFLSAFFLQFDGTRFCFDSHKALALMLLLSCRVPKQLRRSLPRLCCQCKSISLSSLLCSSIASHRRSASNSLFSSPFASIGHGRRSESKHEEEVEVDEEEEPVTSAKKKQKIAPRRSKRMDEETEAEEQEEESSAKPSDQGEAEEEEEEQEIVPAPSSRPRRKRKGKS